MSDHPLRKVIIDDLNSAMNYPNSPYWDKQTDALLEKIANDLYPFIKKQGFSPWGTTKICTKCGKWNRDTVSMGDGVMCPKCREKPTYKPKYVAKVVEKNGTKKYIGEVKGESLPDLWGNFSVFAKNKKFPYREGSRFYAGIDPKTLEPSGTFLYMELNGKPLSINAVAKLKSRA